MNHIGEGVKMGRDVKIWHFTYIGDGTSIGYPGHTIAQVHCWK